MSKEKLTFLDVKTFESDVKVKLLLRGFTDKYITNNRGLIGAVIDETILKTIKR